MRQMLCSAYRGVLESKQEGTSKLVNSKHETERLSIEGSLSSLLDQNALH